MPTPDFDVIAAMFSALGHAARLAILRELLRAHPDGLVVTEIQERVPIPGSTLSHHLDALRQAGIVESTREAQRIRYRARVPALREVLHFLSTECCAENRLLEIRDLAPAPRARQRNAGLRRRKSAS